MAFSKVPDKRVSSSSNSSWQYFMVFRMVNFGGLNLTDINSCLASELVISLSFQSRDLSSRIYVPAKENIYKDGFYFQRLWTKVIRLLVSLQVIELNVDSLIASFQQCEIGKRITKFFILSISFKWREDVIEIELPNIVYSVFSVTKINNIRNWSPWLVKKIEYENGRKARKMFPSHFFVWLSIIILYLQGSLVSSLICVLNLITSSLAPFIGLNFIRRCFSYPPVFSLMTEWRRIFMGFIDHSFSC